MGALHGDGMCGVGQMPAGQNVGDAAAVEVNFGIAQVVAVDGLRGQRRKLLTVSDGANAHGLDVGDAHHRVSHMDGQKRDGRVALGKVGRGEEARLVIGVRHVQRVRHVPERGLKDAVFTCRVASLRLDHARIVALVKVHADQTPAAPGGVDDAMGAGDAVGQRLGQEHIQSALQRKDRGRFVQAVGRVDSHGVKLDLLNHPLVVIEAAVRPNAVLIAEFLSKIRLRIGHRLDRQQIGISAGEVQMSIDFAHHRPDADQPQSKLVHRDSLQPSILSVQRAAAARRR